MNEALTQNLIEKKKWYKRKFFIALFIFVLIAGGYLYYYVKNHNAVVFQEVRILLPQTFNKLEISQKDEIGEIGCLYNSADVACFRMLPSEYGGKQIIFSITTVDQPQDLFLNTKEARTATLNNFIDKKKIEDKDFTFDIVPSEFKNDAAFWVTEYSNDIFCKNIYFIKTNKIYVIGFCSFSKEFLFANWPELEKSILEMQFID